VLGGARINNAVKCLPPQNKPLPVEIANCNAYLVADLATVQPGSAVLALGRIAHDAALRALALKPRDYPFAHNAKHALNLAVPGVALFDSYHCSRYNTNTRRLTEAMFRDVFVAIAVHLGREAPA
jgi:uracil-DNA glycosylase